ncbi:hypothetical protein GWK47_020074 [Chionoecetes opilio]|uniref:Uncharacterized protein n=1 Tax=Chionoecetes opilio TaxID=41210 RepID=A0A8J4XPW8_CHIOP|nr:hypothetical protein GWK47_020074 [Chionoecetes opilio]
MGLFPQASPHADHTPAVAAALDRKKDLGPTPSLFTAATARPPPLQHRAAPPGAPGKGLRRSGGDDREWPAVPLIIHGDGKLVGGRARVGIGGGLPFPVFGEGIRSC